MERTKEVDSLLCEIEEVVILIWQQNKEVYKKLQSVIAEIGKCINELVCLIEQYEIENLRIEFVVENLKKVIIAYERRDEILLADILNYEIYNIIFLYRKLLEGMEENKNEFI